MVPVCLIITASYARAQRDIWDPAVNKVSTRHELSFVYHKFHKSAKWIIVFICQCFIENIIKNLISRKNRIRVICICIKRTLFQNVFDIIIVELKQPFRPNCHFLTLNSDCIKRFYTYDNIYFLFSMLRFY